MTNISNYYGGPPSLECGPHILLGPPDCAWYGDCGISPAAWETDVSIDPPLGTLLYVKFYNSSWGGDGYARGYSGGKAPGHLREIHADGTVTLAMIPMFKYDGMPFQGSNPSRADQRLLCYCLTRPGPMSTSGAGVEPP